MNGKLFSNTIMQQYLYQDLYQLEESHWWHKNKRELVFFFIKQNITDKKNRILDVGCGTGKNIEVFSKLGECWGIDTSPSAIAFCKKRGIKKTIKGNIEQIPFSSQSFNVITALDVLEHVDDSKSLKEIYRVLKKGGVIIATVPAFPKLWSKWDEVLHHKRRYTSKSLKRILQENKFKIIKISYFYLFLIIPIFLVRLVKNFFFKNYYPSDFKLSNNTINYLLRNISGFERFFIPFLSLPFGTSLIVVARKE